MSEESGSLVSLVSLIRWKRDWLLLHGKKALENGNREASSKYHFAASQFNELIDSVVELDSMSWSSVSLLHASAEAVIAMECDRVNSDKSLEPYDPIANPGQFDDRVVALALALLPETHWRIDSLCCAVDEFFRGSNEKEKHDG